MNLRSFSTLQIALGVSVAVHAVLLTVRFVDPEAFNRVFQDTPLEVVLVNANTQEKPDRQVQAIAQTSLAGGGEAAAGRATSPLLPSDLTSPGDSAEDAQRQQEMRYQQQVTLLAKLRKELAALPPPEQRNANSAEVAANEEKRRLKLKLLAEIERRINEENSKPRKRYVSPSTREEVFAIYYDGLRRKIEDRGTRNFPEHEGRKLYGELIMQVAIDFDGRVMETIVEQSSGNPMLDRRAVSIARNAGPFGRVPDKVQVSLLATGYNRLAFVQTFKFTADQALETTLRAR